MVWSPKMTVPSAMVVMYLSLRYQLVEAGPIDTHATKETANLFYKLRSLAKDPNRILFGMQMATLNGVQGGHSPYKTFANPKSHTKGWEYTVEMAKENKNDELCDVKGVTGHYPAVIGFDLYDLQDKIITPLKTLTKLAYARGSVITFSMHMSNPVTHGPVKVDDDHKDVEHTLRRLLPGGQDHDVWRHRLDGIADIAHSLRDHHGRLIPIIFRPFHENNGKWFFWGQGNKAHNTPDDFIKIWRYTVDYLRNTKGVHNFLYAYSPNAGYPDLNTDSGVTSYMKTYPGDSYVDIWGVDDYSNVIDQSRFQNFADRMSELVAQAEERNKIPALTEVGFQGNGIDTHPDFWLSNVLNPLKGKGIHTPRPNAAKIAYMLAWHNTCYSDGNCPIWVPHKGHPGEKNFLNFYKDRVTIFSDGVPDFYYYN